MKIAILNFSGNVGKTTLARDLFKLNLPHYQLISVESINEDYKEELVIRGEEGNKLLAEIVFNDNLILDIGSSNLDAFFREGTKEREILDNIDIFVIPTTTEIKQQKDTIRTLRYLVDYEVNDRKIFIIPNMVALPTGQTIKDLYKLLANKTEKLPNVYLDLDYYIEKHNLYIDGKSLSELFTEEDYMELMEDAKARGDMEEAKKYAYKYAKQKQVHRLYEHYQKILAFILGEEATEEIQ